MEKQAMTLDQMREKLLQIKSEYYGDKMLSLISGEEEESDRRIRQYLQESEGRFREVYVQVHVKGITATEYFQWQSQAMRDAITGSPEAKKRVTLETVFPAHPEHYMILGSGVIESIGGLPTNASVCQVEKTPDFLAKCADPSFFGLKNTGVKLSDGTIWAYGLTEYKDIPGGAEMKLHVFWPEKCPEYYFEDHIRHFCIEHRNFIHMAYDDLAKKGKAKEPLEITFDTALGFADEKRVDEWEMMAAETALQNLENLISA